MQHPASRAGEAYPLGASIIESGVNFALFSQHASAVEVCLFDTPHDPREIVRVQLRGETDGVWHGLIPGLTAGQLYGFRVHGAFRPEEGHLFDPSKLLLDPYARAITGAFRWSNVMPAGARQEPFDTAASMPKCVVVDSAFDWTDDRAPKTRLGDSVIYELHVKGFSQLAAVLPHDIRGTYAALGSSWAISHLQALGVTAVELLPVQHFVNDRFLEDRGLTNYWGYNPIGFFAPHAMYAASGGTGAQVREFKTMVKSLHAAGIEVILDVVFNHTGEGDRTGPTLSFRGIDNASYYLSPPGEPAVYADHTGCGNTLNAAHPRVLQLIMDALRYWVLEMRVDGFRFDLATTLGREGSGFDRGAAFFDIIRQDPVLSQVKLIAEPWDLGPGGYQVGNFPPPFAEWNGKFRDGVRAYWRGDEGTLGGFAQRITGSSDLYEWARRTPATSINFITSHDGFTLADLVSYNDKHNEANGEGNRDGENHNRSFNFDVEGMTNEPEVCRLRRRQRRNFLATLFLSQGVPMLCAGDEYGRSQGGNNNAYCHDSELSWVAWDRNAEERRFEAFVRALIAFRRDHAAFRRPRFFPGRAAHGVMEEDIVWFAPDGREMTASEWTSPDQQWVAVSFAQDAAERPELAESWRPEAFMMLFNAGQEPVRFRLAGRGEVAWRCLLDTSEEDGFLATPTSHRAGEEFLTQARSMCLFQMENGASEDALPEVVAARQGGFQWDGIPLPSPEPLDFRGHA